MKKRFYAVKPGGKIRLATTSAAERFLKEGFSIISIEDGIKETIATPEEGWLGNRPEISVTRKNDRVEL